jgi:sec-independent protein translocase protein TatC
VCAALFLFFAASCFSVSERVLGVLASLLGKKLVSFSPEEGFLALASLSLYCAFALTLPIAGYLLWDGALLPRFPAWRKWGIPVFAAATALFLCGVLLGYFVILPAGIGFLVGFETEGIRALISARKFVRFCGGMLLALGLAFEMPLVSFFLARLGWLTPSFFRRRWRHAVIVCTVLAAVITPTPDIYNMMLMMAPLLAIYILSFLVVLAAETAKPKTETGTLMSSAPVWGQRCKCVPLLAPNSSTSRFCGSAFTAAAAPGRGSSGSPPPPGGPPS